MVRGCAEGYIPMNAPQRFWHGFRSEFTGIDWTMTGVRVAQTVKGAAIGAAWALVLIAAVVVAAGFWYLCLLAVT